MANLAPALPMAEQGRHYEGMARAANTTTKSTLHRLFLSPVRAGAIALVIVASFGGTSISSFIDCNDSFWAVACGIEVPAPQPPATSTPGDEVLGISIVLESGMVCTGLQSDVVTCLR